MTLYQPTTQCTYALFNLKLYSIFTNLSISFNYWVSASRSSASHIAHQSARRQYSFLWSCLCDFCRLLPVFVLCILTADVHIHRHKHKHRCMHATHTPLIHTHLHTQGVYFSEQLVLRSLIITFRQCFLQSKLTHRYASTTNTHTHVHKHCYTHTHGWPTHTWKLS